MLFWFLDLESSKFCLSVSLFLEFLDLGFWEWPQHCIVTPLSVLCNGASTSECFSTQRNSGPIYKCSYRTLCCVTDYSSGPTWHLSFQVLQKPPPSTRSQASLPVWPWKLGGLVATLHWLLNEDVSLDLSPACPPVNVHHRVIGTGCTGHWGSLLAMAPTPSANKSFCIVTHWRFCLA